MKNIYILLLLTALGLTGRAQNGLENIYVERYYVSDAIDAANSNPTLPAGSVTYRIYADLLPGYKVQSIYGSPQHPLTMTTTTSFFNQSDFGLPVPTFSATNAKTNTVMLDSWLTTGGACNGYLGIPKTDDNGIGNFVNSNVPQLLQNNSVFAGIPLTTQDGMTAGTVPLTTTLGLDNSIGVFGDGTTNGNSFYVTNGAWACLNGASGPVPATNKVLIAQITTDGTFHFELNIQIGTPTLGTEKYVSSSPVSGEYTLAGLTQTLHAVPVPPVVSISAPFNNATISSLPLTISASASDIEGTIASVEFYADGNYIGNDLAAPYDLTYSGLADGTHVLTVKAFDNYGQFTVSDPVNINISTVKTLNMVLFVEGLYNGSGAMNKAQGDAGDQFPGTTADKVNIELRDATSGAVVYALNDLDLHTDGSISGNIPSIHNGSYYIYVIHRNSITVSSAAPVSFSSGVINYNFSSAAQAFGDNLKIVDGVAVLYSGDVNQDGGVDASDMISVDNDNAAFGSGYLSTDVDGSGGVDASDMIIVDNNNALFIGAVLPF